MAVRYMTAKVEVPHDSGLPKDAVTNTWAYTIPDGTALLTGITQWVARLDAFYSALLPILSSAYDWANINVKTFDMEDLPPRVPIDEDVFSAGAVGTSGHDLPAEVAIVLSFRGALASGTNIRRRRGRVYIGPLQGGAADQEFTPSLWPGLVADAANTHLLVPGATAGNVNWCVYSRSQHWGVGIGEPIPPDTLPVIPIPPTSFTQVEHLWCDNAWDTQRRRGRAATTRVSHDA